MANFGELLREFRTRANLSQRALAQQLGIAASYVSRLERGEREISSRSLALRIVAVLNLSPEEIDLWLISAGYISPRIEQLANTGISRLMDSLKANKVEAPLDN